MPKHKEEHTRTFVPKAPVGIQKPPHVNLKKPHHTHATHTRHFEPAASVAPAATVHTRTFIPAGVQGAPITPARLLMANQAPPRVLPTVNPVAPPHGTVTVVTQTRHRV
jgi:hypothetical protein